MHETLLTDVGGLEEGDVNFLNGRANANEAAGYVSEAARKRRIDAANKRIVGAIAGYMGAPSTAQLGANLNLQIGNKTKNIVVSADLLTDPEFVEAIPNSEKFIAGISPDHGEGTYLKGQAPDADPRVTEAFNLEQIAASEDRAEGYRIASLEKRKRRIELEKEVDKIDEEAIRKQVRDQAEKKRIRDDEKAKLAGELDLSPEMDDALKEKWRRLGVRVDPKTPAEDAPDPDAPKGGKAGKIAGKAGKLLGPAGAVLTLTAADMTRQAVTSKLQAMEVPKPVAEVGGFVAGATEFLPVAPSDTADVTPDMFSERPVERAAAEDEVARRGLEDLGMVTEPSRPGNKKGAPAPDSFLTMSP
jgi:hypothetical protein